MSFTQLKRKLNEDDSKSKKLTFSNLFTSKSEDESEEEDEEEDENCALDLTIVRKKCGTKYVVYKNKKNKNEDRPLFSFSMDMLKFVNFCENDLLSRQTMILAGSNRGKTIFTSVLIFNFLQKIQKDNKTKFAIIIFSTSTKTLL